METQVNTIWAIDPMHSEVQFKVKHLVISTVTGQFTSFTGQLNSETEDFDGAHATFEADIDSISTNNEARDEHLKSTDFFDAANHPKLVFHGNVHKQVSGDYELKGTITIRGTEKPITLQAEYGGTVVDPYGNTKAGFEFSGKINRKEFGLAWSATTEAGGIVVSDEVKLVLSVQFAKQA